MKKKILKNRGFIKTIIIVVIAIIILSYYGIDLKKVITSDQVKANLAYVWNIIVNIWDLFIEKIWQPLIS